MSFAGKLLLGAFIICMPLQVLGWDWRTKVTVALKDEPLVTVCELLEQQYGIHFSYSRDIVNLSRRVTFQIRNKPLKKALEEIFSPYDIAFDRIGEQVVLTVKQSPKRTISGYVQDARTGEKLIGATVFSAAQQEGTTTNQYGFFSLTLLKDTNNIQVSYVGYQPVKIGMAGIGKKPVTVGLQPLNSLQEVVITESPQPRLQEQTQMSRINISPVEVKAMPRLLGEADVLRTLAAQPGISSGMEGTSSLNVRGGSPDQNLILLDGTPVFNSAHLFGLFSVFNPDIVKNADLYKGAFPARYGGRLSSVIDISLKDGDMKHYHGEASIGLLAAKFMVEGPIVKDKTSFIVSGRRSYLDLLLTDLKLDINDSNDSKTWLYFYDANIKINHIFSPRDRLYLSVYGGQDNIAARDQRGRSKEEDPLLQPFAERTRFRFGWGNITGTLRWNHVYSPKLFSNSTFNYSQYFFLTDYNYTYESSLPGDQANQYGKYYSRIQNTISKIDFEYRPNPAHVFRFGLGNTTYAFRPGVSVFRDRGVSQRPSDTAYNNIRTLGSELTLYAEDDWEVKKWLHLNLGVHASGFAVEDQFYYSIQPRLGIRFLLPQQWAMKMSYTHMNQYLHLLTNNGSTFPTDLWVPSTAKVKPMFSRQVSLGFARTTKENRYELSLEGYYKTMDNVVEYQENATIFNSAVKKWDEQVVVGRGYAYGSELLLEKKKGSTRGWIGYTLSWSMRKFPGVNKGRAFPYKYDRRHDLELVLIQRLGRHWEATASWEYTTGMPLTLPEASYEGANGSSPYEPDGGLPILDYIGSRNRFRTRDMHRLDLSFTYSKQKKWWVKSWTFSVYNAYNRQNPFYYTVKTDKVKNERKLTQVSILPILPSVTYSIKF